MTSVHGEFTKPATCKAGSSYSRDLDSSYKGGADMLSTPDLGQNRLVLFWKPRDQHSRWPD